MKIVNVGGVPEHFNLPWHLSLKKGVYKKEQINLKWHDYPGGTGDMCLALRNKEIDLAIILTEGIIKDVIAGNPSKIVQTYVQTPLDWGIHVAKNSPYQKVEDLKGTKAAISRMGSGSHLMSYINAEKHGWNLNEDLKFEVVRNLNGAIEGLNNGDASYFLWEKFTTKPLVDTGVFRRIGHCPSPWPCFVIAAREDFIKSNTKELKIILEKINLATSEFKTIPKIEDLVASQYNQKHDDVQQWLQLTEWSQNLIDKETISKTQNKLLALNIIPNKVEYEALIHQL